MQTVSLWVLLALCSGYASAILSPIHRSNAHHADDASHISLDWGGDNSMVTVELAMNYSTVVLETLAGISAVDCDDTWVRVTFSSADEFARAQSSWSSFNGSFVMVTNHMGDCDAEFERGFFLADVETLGSSAADLTIQANVEKTDVAHTTDEIITHFSHAPPVEMRRRGLNWDKKGLEISGNMTLEPGTQLLDFKEIVTITADRASANAYLLYSGTIRYSLLQLRLTQWTMDVVNTIEQDLALSLNFRKPFTFEVEFDVVPLGYPIIEIPGIIELGPALNLGVGVNFTVSSSLALRTAVTSGINNATLHIDFLNPDKSRAENWLPTYSATANISTEAVVTLQPYAHTTLEFEAKFLKGLADFSVGAQIRPSFPIQFGGSLAGGAGVQGSAGNNRTTSTNIDKIDHKCPNGFGVNIAHNLHYVLFATKWHKRFNQIASREVGTYCYNWFDDF